MIRIKDIGNFDSVPPLVEAVIQGNIPGMESALGEGWDINRVIKIGKYTSETPLDLALIMECFPSVKWLVEHKAELNKKNNPAFLRAVRYCDEPVIRYLVDQGAKVDGVNQVDTEAFQQALYGKKIKNLAIIHELGHRVEVHGGPALRSAVSDRNYAAVDFFIDHGVDINYNGADQVYPFKPTPLCVAARYVDMKMVRYLVDRGADIRIAESGGMRPYNIALERGDQEMADFFKSLEPPEFHSLQNKLLDLKKYKLPAELVAFLQGNELRLNFSSDYTIGYIDFFPLVDTVEMKQGRTKLLRISREVDNYTHLYIVWNPKVKSIACYDTEHDELMDIAPFGIFLKDAAEYMEKVLNGGFLP